MQDIFELAHQTEKKINPSEPYHRAYPHLINYFSGLREINPADVVRGAHMVYGWMPTILEMHWGQKEHELQAGAATLNKARDGENVSKPELENLSNLINHSLVGASKLLHFAAPSHYPIWDSRVYRFFYNDKPHHNRLQNQDKFLNYVSKMQKLAKDEQALTLASSLEKKLGYPVTPVRAIELIMFIHGAKNAS